MKKITIIILFLLPVILKAQSLNVDSLMNVLETQKLSDDDKFSIYNRVCYYYLNSDSQKAMQYCQQALTFAKGTNNQSMIASFYAYIGTIHKFEGEYDKAHECYDQALEHGIKGVSEPVVAFVYGSIAGLYYQEGKAITALDYFLKSLSLYEKGDTDNHKRQQITMLSNIGTLRYELEDLDLAIQSFEKAEKSAIELNDSGGLMQIYNNLGNIYIKKDEPEKALDYVLKSLELSRSGSDKRFECSSLGLLALIYKSSDFNDLVKAEEYANECLDIAKQMNFPLLLNGAWHILANVYLAQGRYAESEVANSTAWELDSLSTIAFQIQYDIGLANIHLGDKEKAIYHFGKSREISKKSTSKSFQNLFLDMEVKYETEKKEMRISALEKEKTLYIWLGVAIAVASLSIIGLLFYRHRSAIQNRKIAEQQIYQLKHEKEFIAIQSSLKAEKAERDLIAHDLHDSVSSLLTVVKNNMNLYSDSKYKDISYYNNAFEVLNKSITELRRVVYHLKSFILTKEGLAAALDDFCRFIPNAEFHFKGINSRFDPDKEYVLYDCACELINNALKHSGASRIDVHLNMNEQTVYLSIADNGTGFNSREVKSGIGLDNIRSNLSAFGGHLDILSEPDKGTEANVELEL